MNNLYKHFKKICIHKYWVAKYCFKVRLYWQGIFHDMSKFSPVEFFESVKFYMGTSSPINEAKRVQGYSKAWQHHKGRNPHHYEYWTDNYDAGTTTIQMPFRYALELVCDYVGAARAYLGENFTFHGELEWWNKKSLEVKMHPQTIMFVTRCMQVMDKENRFITRKEASSIYNAEDILYKVKQAV